MKRVACAAVAGALIAGSAAVSGVPLPPAWAGGQQTASHPSSTRRADLVGRQLDAGRLSADRVVSVIVELTGDTVDERAGRAPFVNESSAQLGIVREQRSADLALLAAGATVTGRLVRTMNGITARIAVRDIPRLQRVKGVKSLQVARRVERLNALANVATGAPSAWDGFGLTGAGVTIGVIDDGIDYTHADFGGSGNPADYTGNNPNVVEGGSFPTAKVVGGADFVGDEYDVDDPDLDTPHPDGDPLVCGLHGTHVAGTAAGFGVDDATGLAYTGGYTAAALSGVSFRVAPGSAPQALLRAYKVFGCSGASDDSVIVAAIDRAVADHVDVLNMSLGESLGGGSTTDLVVRAVQRASSLGTLVVAAAGSAGSAPYLTSTPSTAGSALSVAAMDAGPTSFPGVAFDTAPSIIGVETNEVSIGAGVSGPLKVLIPGCDDEDFTDLGGKIVVLSAVEGCVTPVFDALDGVLAVVVIVEDFFRAGLLEVNVPFVVVREVDAAPLIAADGNTVSLTPTSPVANPGAGKFADFSSGGPRRGDSALKPDVTAPGVSLYSARAGSGSGSAEISGTSMASPHVAGLAALVTQAHPTWKPSQIKAALVSTADPAAITDFDPIRGGTGLVSAVRAATSVAYLSTTDGRQSLGFGLITMKTAGALRSKLMRLTNTSNAPITYNLSASFNSPDYGSTVTVTPSTVTVAARSSRSITVRLRLASAIIPGLPSASDSDFGALVHIDGIVTADPVAPAVGVYPLRMAFAAVPKALSSVATPTRVSKNAGAVTVRNFGRHAGTADVFQWLYRDRTGDNPDREVPDVIDVGVKSFPWDPNTLTETGPDRQIVFAINTRSATSTHSSQVFLVSIDADDDEVEDFMLVGGDEGLVLDGDANGRFVTLAVDPATFTILDAFESEAPFNTSVVYLRAMASSLGANELTTWGLWVTGTSLLLDDIPQDDAPPTSVLTFSPFHPKLSANASAPITVAPGASVVVPFVVDTSQPQSAKGLMVISPDDSPGLPTAGAITVTGL